MIGRNCGIYTEDDLLLDPDGDGGAVVGDRGSAAESSSGMPTTRYAITANPLLLGLTLTADVVWNAG